MDRLSKILLGVIAILVIILIIVSALYITERKKSGENLNTVLDYAMETYEANKKINELKEELRNLDIHINEITDIAEAKIDANSESLPKEEISEELYDFINRISVPEKYQFESISGVYIKSSKNKPDYDILRDYVFKFTKNESSYINITVSEVGAPLRDVLFDSDSAVSNLKDMELYIYQYEGKYIVEFNDGEKYFYIEATGITEDQLFNLLDSIITELGKGNN